MGHPHSLFTADLRPRQDGDLRLPCPMSEERGSGLMSAVCLSHVERP